MEAYCVEVQKLEDKFNGFELHHVLRWDNEEADFLARLVSSRRPPLHGVFLDILDALSICLEGDKTLAPAGIASTLTCVTKEAPSPQECVVGVTMHSRRGTEPLASSLPGPPAHPMKHRR